MNVTGALQSGLIGLNRTLDNSVKSSSDIAGNGRPVIPEQASGRDLNSAVRDTTLEETTEAATTKVVTDASEVLGTNIDTRA